MELIYRFNNKEHIYDIEPTSEDYINFMLDEYNYDCRFLIKDLAQNGYLSEFVDNVLENSFKVWLNERYKELAEYDYWSKYDD